MFGILAVVLILSYLLTKLSFELRMATKTSHVRRQPKDSAGATNKQAQHYGANTATAHHAHGAADRWTSAAPRTGTTTRIDQPRQRQPTHTIAR